MAFEWRLDICLGSHVLVLTRRLSEWQNMPRMPRFVNVSKRLE
jgi:hypothetical protein